MKSIAQILMLGLSGLFLSMLGTVQAQTVLWSENFDDGNGNSRWYADDGVWQIGTPTFGPGSAHSGSDCAGTGLTANYPVDANSRLIRIQSFTVPAANQFPRLRFYEWYNFANCEGSDYGVVEIKVVGSNTWQAVSPQRPNVSGGWTDCSVDLSAYAGQNIQVAFHMVWAKPGGYTCSGNTAPGWYIDDVALVYGTPVLNNPEGFENGIGDWYAETGTWQVGVPTNGPGSAHGGTNCVATSLSGNYPVYADSRFVSPVFTVPATNQFPRLRFYEWYNFANCEGSDYGVVEIKVYGSNTWQAISPERPNISGGWTDCSVDLSAYAGQNVQVAFHMVWAKPGGYTCSGNTAPGWYVDDISLVSGTPVLNDPEGFENGIGDWYAETGTWQVGQPTKANGPATNSVGSQAHGGINCAATILNANYPLYANSRLVSPTFQVPPSSASPYLRFWHWYSFADCEGSDYGVVEIKGTNGVWQAVSSDYVDNSGVWSEPYIDLTSFGGQKVQLGFHMVWAKPGGYTCSGNLGQGWYIDDVQVFPSPSPANPLSAIPNTNINEQVLWQYTPTVSGSGYSFGLSNAPAGMAVNASSGLISWLPGQTNATHTYSNITYTVSQSSAVVAWTNFNVTVNDLNTPPGFQLNVSAQTVYATTALAVTDPATNSDIWAASLTYALVSPPSGASINSGTGAISWTPTVGQVGTNTLTVSATDNDPDAVNSQQLSVTNSFTVVVKGLTAPTFTLSPSNLVVGVGHGFTFTALATGYPSPTYQWQFSSNGVTYVNLNGATAASYSLASAAGTNIGYYRVVAVNSQGSVTNTVRLTFLTLNLYAGLNIYGPVGANYLVESTPALNGSNWTTLTNVALPSQPYIYIDYGSVTNAKQFYQTVPQ